MSTKLTGEEDYLQSYAANENIINSIEFSASDKENAWRQQALLLQHLTHDDAIFGNTSPAVQYDLMKQHFEKPRASREVFLEERVNAVEALLHKREGGNVKDVLELPKLDEIEFELPCHGSYASCAYDEITTQDLTQTSQPNSTPSASPSFNRSERNDDIKSKTTRNNTISNFLQPLKLPQNSSAAINGNETNAAGNTKSPQNFSELQYSGYNGFHTAREELILQNAKKSGIVSQNCNNSNTTTFPTTTTSPYMNYANNTKKTLGTRRTVRSNFIPPLQRGDELLQRDGTTNQSPSNTPPDDATVIEDKRLCNIDAKMIDLIRNEIMHKCENVDWNDIAGLKYAKSIIQETIVYPLRRPDIFNNLRRPPRGILLFGPPGTGKTLIGKCIASQAGATFFSISASSLTSKWMGESEKMVRALFAVAAVEQPSVIFIDEIDSLLSKRNETEHEGSRRLKTEFLARIEGAATTANDNIIFVGATNRPQELDDAARRRLVRRLYIPLPDVEARIEILTNLLKAIAHSLTATELNEIANMSDGYSGADMKSLCQEASLAPIRDIPLDKLDSIDVNSVRSINLKDFHLALQAVSPSVSPADIKQYIEWNRIYGAGLKT